MIPKQYIHQIIKEKNGLLSKLLDPKENNINLHGVLKSIGRLPNDFDGQCFVSLIEHPNDKIRLLAVKNIGILNTDRYLGVVTHVAQNEKNTMIRREAISSIGRMRSEKAIPFLLKKLEDSDPKIVLQVVRALLVFKNHKNVREQLKNLAHHPNEMIQSVIEREFSKSETVTQRIKKHSESPHFMKNVVVHGDVRKTMNHVPDESIHLTFTSPPYYNARDYSIYQSYKDYLKFFKRGF
ncbi:MAG: hypothetical protein HOC71_07035 [Candidatus Latescibacteria bacterium]|jgi:hypothetical protein|nr:hypothetical protein [Candidatus Latescibacterota bacterium]